MDLSSNPQPIRADELITDAAERMFGELCTPQTVTAAEDGVWPAALWDAIEQSELARAWVPEALGGAGTSLVDGFAVARIASAHAAPLPIAETLLAGWLLGEGGVAPPAGPLAVAPVQSADVVRLGDDGRLAGSARRIPFAASAGHLAVACEQGEDTRIALVDVAGCSLEAGRNLAGEPLDTVRFDGVEPAAVSQPVSNAARERLRRMGATLRAQQIAGALARILEQSLQYARDREQFGRPIGKFQAVQHNLASLAGESAAAGAAADAAAIAISRHGLDDPRTLLAVASAKIRAGEAAGTGAAIAHQVHGAIGFTREYSLQQATRRLWSWRDDYGAETAWAIELGRHVATRGAEKLWGSLTEI